MPISRTQVEEGRRKNEQARSAGTAPATPSGRDRVTLTLPEPPSANRWWRNWKGRMVLSSEARKYKASIAQLGGSRLIEGEVAIALDWYRGRKSGDLDKRIGVLLDALQGVCYANDKHIVAIHARRFDDPKNPRVVVGVWRAA